MSAEQEQKEVRELITLIRIEIGVLGAKVDGIKDLGKKVDDIATVANEALQSSRSAHHRLNDLQTGQRWLIGTTISVVALFLTAIGFLWKIIERTGG